MRTVVVRSSILCALALAASPVAAAPVLVASTSTHPGIVHETWRDDAIPARIHVVRVDLTSAEIGVFATQEVDRGLTTSQFAARIGAQVAINGDAFAVASFVPEGLAIGDATPWSTTLDDERSALFHLRRVGERTVASISPPEVIDTYGALPPATQGGIGGRPLLIRAGQLEGAFDCADPVMIPCQRAPRSALALSSDGNSLYVVAVDGWQAGSIGLTAPELASFLRTTKNPYVAMGLDVGSSSTLVLDGAVVNTPSDGVERRVANHLGVKFGALPRGQLVGLICKDDVIACRDDTSLRLPGAEVTLDDGRVQIVGSDAQYNFAAITPRLACITVRKAGFKTKVACDTVPSGGIAFESVALEAGVDPVDAGVADAPLPVDAAGDADGGLRPDAGNPEIGDGGGCCDSGRPQPTLAVLVGLVGFMCLRRRGTTAPR